MVTYEVNLTIKNEIYDDYYTWLLQHVKQLLKLDGFCKAEIGLIEQANVEEKHLRVSYHIHSYNNLENYLKNHAETMRSEGVKKFGHQFSASRRIIRELITLETEPLLEHRR